MIIVLDLDDTLYNEIDYVKSGFACVADYLHRKFNVDANQSYARMLDELEKNGRGRIFNVLLRYYGFYSKKNVNQCVSVYRLHHPSITINEDALRFLERFYDKPKYIITDGNKIVQKNKINALRISHFFKRIFITNIYGIKYTKPSPYCFLKISEIEHQPPQKIVYIADNPNKDFLRIKPLGFKTVRINQGMYKNIVFTEDHDAQVTVETMDELTSAFLKKVMHDK